MRIYTYIFNFLSLSPELIIIEAAVEIMNESFESILGGDSGGNYSDWGEKTLK